MSLAITTNPAQPGGPVFAGAGTKALTRLLERMAEVGRLPERSDFLDIPMQRKRVLGELARLQEILRPGEVEPFARELRRFHTRERSPAELARVTAAVWPMEHRTMRRSPSLLDKIGLFHFGEPVRERAKSEPPYFVTPSPWAAGEARYPDDRVPMTRIFDGPAFREYLWRIGINPADVTKLKVDNYGFLDRGGTKTCYRLTITTSRGKTVSIAMRLIPSHLDGFLPELEREAMVTRELSQSAVAHLIPKFQGSAIIKVSERPPFTYLAFFNEWIDAPSLLDLLLENRDEAPSLDRGALKSAPRTPGRSALAKPVASLLVQGALQTFADAVRRVPLFISADVAPIDIKVIRRRRGSPRFVFFDFGGGFIDPFTYARHIYRQYATPSSLLARPIVPPDEILPVLQGIPEFRRALHERLGFFKRGQLLQDLSLWSAQDEAIEIEMLDHLWRLTDPAGYALARQKQTGD